MNEEDLMYMQQQQRELDLAQQQAYAGSGGMVSQDIAAAQLKEQQRSIIYDQLSLDDELVLIENLLRSKELKRDKDGNTEWTDPEDKERIILAEYGVQLIMNTISFYLNKNTLLSNYDEDTILHKMEDFATDLADTIFMEYEKVFRYPTFLECKAVLLDRIDKKTQLKHFAREIIGEKNIDDAKIKEDLLGKMENTIEKEIEKIKEQIIKNKLKRFLILIREIQDAVHSTYLRALFGQERRTLRQHIHVTETSGLNMQQQQTKKGGMNPMSFFRGKIR